MSINIKIAKDRTEWEALVSKCPQKTIFHTWEFLKIIEKHTKNKFYPLIGLKAKEPIGIYPLFHKKGLLNIVFSPPPKGGLLYLGPLIINQDKLKQNKLESTFSGLQKCVDVFIFSEIKANYVRIRTAPGLIDLRPMKWRGYNIEPLYTYIVDVEQGIDNMWSSFSTQLRGHIKKTQREGVLVEEGTKSDLDTICNSVAQRFKEQGLVSNIPKNYLIDLYDSFYPKNLKVFTIKYNDKTIGGQLTLYHEDKATMWIGLSKIKKRGIYPNELLQWEIMRSAYAEGYKYYELMDAGVNQRLRYFKSKFNPKLALWYSTEKYSSPLYRNVEKTFRVYQKIKNRS